jgi:glycosyltransferase involved in cell wall biosynthesis
MDKTAYAKSVVAEVEANHLENHIINIGTIPSNKVGPLISEIDAMINIAQLESFSNNFIEAWTFKKPLIVTDSDWSRDSCLKSALYVNVEDVEDTVKKIYELISNKDLSSKLISTYEQTLNTYLDYKEKTIKYIEIIESKGRRN